MWKLVSNSGAVICWKDTVEEIGEELLWYSNRGYLCHVERERQSILEQTALQ